ncbi:glycosyltransferase [Persicitalea jodogahamensis]|uniref:Glycosyl transferase n=1 Tax=Persicitalea jodogahamensis TaxID=402147 RepID=A0A8J3DC49_9BACT|nr:nucleotide disphospho-sugar-binding domain-containing protein [Persicitalea jodogahamensis]GHB75453.1 glycosyl transferase [Persicitalea jodogahamensis]
MQKKILFATMPMDGHLKPLTGLAVHLKNCGYDVRWYSGPSYAATVEKLSIPYFPFHKAKEINQDNLELVFPERQRIKGTVPRLRFDMEHIFLRRIPEFIEDLKKIREEFNFDLVVCDVLFAASPLIQPVFGVPVAAAGIAPLGESSNDLPPAGMGMEPAQSFWGRRKQDFLRLVSQEILFKSCTRIFNQYLRQYGIRPQDRFFLDTLVRHVDVYWQSGVPGFEYFRSTTSPNVKYVGPLLPYQVSGTSAIPDGIDSAKYRRMVLVTQGTVERNPEKLLVPTLSAFADDPATLVIATTGGSFTQELQLRFPQPNIYIHDFIDFAALMPLADVFVTNAGYGGVLMAASHGLPMVVAGVHEGKSEIAARVNYFRLGISLKTERPGVEQVREAVEAVLKDPNYRRNTERLSREFLEYDANRICQESIERLLAPTPIIPELWF